MTLNKNNWGGQQSYESPSVKLLDIDYEGMLCQSKDTYTLGGGGIYEESDIYDNGTY